MAEKIIHPGEQVSGLIAFRSEKPIHELDIRIEKSNFDVIGKK